MSYLTWAWPQLQGKPWGLAPVTETQLCFHPLTFHVGSLTHHEQGLSQVHANGFI